MASHDENKANLVGDRLVALNRLKQAPTNPRNGFLERFYDNELRIPRETTTTSLSRAEVERIAHTLAVVLSTGSMARRLGPEADNQDLSLDKRRAKRVAHALGQSLNAWTRRPNVELDQEIIRREGAQLEWSSFAAEHRIQVYTSCRTFATWSIRNDELRWGKSSVGNLVNELSWMLYALRD